MRKELFYELNKAMTSNPDLSALEVMEFVLDTYKPYRDKFYSEERPYEQETFIYTRRTNSEIYKALKMFNDRK